MSEKYTETVHAQPVIRCNGTGLDSIIRKIVTSEDGQRQTGEATDQQGNTFKVKRDFRSSSIWNEVENPNDAGVILRQYVDALSTISRMPPRAQDFIAAQARKIVLLELQLHKLGWKPVFHGSWWDLDVKVDESKTK